MLDTTKNMYHSQDEIKDIITRQRAFFNTGKTRSLEYRLHILKKLRRLIAESEAEVSKALKSDLNKGEFESYVAETGFVLGDLEHTIAKLKKWMKPKKVSSPLVHLPVSSFIKREPLGSVLIIGPWNYPFQLIMAPLVGAIAAGNTTVLKPSELAPATSALLKKLINNNFDMGEIYVVEGAIDETTYLLEEKFDYIFYTGSGPVGKIIMEKAAKHLTPVTLELGGKSPCVIFGDVDLTLVAKRIAWGKFMNAGQTCVAPDYILIEERLKEKFVEEMKTVIQEFYGDDPKASPDYCRIINSRHFDRLKDQIVSSEVLIGGDVDASSKYISPTVLSANENSPSMKDEIFGPILPVLTILDFAEVLNFINSRPKPLALYLFSNNKKYQELILNETSSGGLLINDTIIHLSNMELPFGGVGDSGMGGYHGEFSFDIFSHKKSVMKRHLALDVPIKYPPYSLGKLNIIKKLLKWFG